MQHEQKKPMSAIFSEFCDETTAHAFYQIGDGARRPWARAMWLIILITFTGVFSFQAYQLVLTYLQFGTTVQTTLETADELTFPTITFCNVNAFQQSKVPKGSCVDQYSNLVKNVSHMDDVNSLKKALCTNASGEWSAGHVHLTYICDDYDWIQQTGDSMTSQTTSADTDQTSSSTSTTTSTTTTTTTTTTTPPMMPPGPNGPQVPGMGASSQSSGAAGQPPPPAGAPGGQLIDPMAHQRANAPPPGPKPSLIFLEKKAFRDIGTMTATFRQTLNLSDWFQSQDDFMQECQFNMKPCDTTHLKAVEHAWYGVCYQFNSGGEHESIRAGPQYGLNMILHVNKTQYLHSTYEIGVRVAVHQASRTAFPEINGFSGTVGLSTSVGVSRVDTSRLPNPYSNCLKDSILREQPDRYFYPDEYTQNGCRLSCLQKRIIAKCDCFYFAYNPPPNFTAPLCKTPKELNCARNEELAPNDSNDCSCPPPCNETEYRLTLSQTQWPADWTVPDRLGPPGTTATNYSKDNLVKIQIYYDSMSYYVYTYQESYSVTSLVSDFGGQFGLWVGASFCTVGELIMLVISLIGACCGVSKQHVEKEKKSTYNAQQEASIRNAAPPPRNAVYPKVPDVYYG